MQQNLKAKMKTFIAQLKSGEIKSKQLKCLNYIKEHPAKPGQQALKPHYQGA